MADLQSTGKVKSVKSNIEACEWVIENFNTINLDTGSFLTSPMIPTDNPKIKWRLALYPRGRNHSVSGYLSLYVQLFSNMGQGSEISANVRLFLIDSSDEIHYETSYNCSIELLPEVEYHNTLSLKDDYGEDEFVDRNDVILVNDCLKVGCEIVIIKPLPSSLLSSYSSQVDDRLKEFDEFKKLLTDDKFGDFTLDIGNKEIRVHKAILANRSPVFEAMLKNEMQETEQNRVVITDIEYSVLKNLLQFMYTGTIDDIKNATSELLIAADKYCVTGLKTLCEKCLSINELNVENALDRLTLADTYNCSYLKSQVIEFMVHNSKKMIEKKEFALLRGDLLFEIIRIFSEKSAVSTS